MFTSNSTSDPTVLDPKTLIKATSIFLGVFALYFLTRSPGLDEIDSINFAMGVLHFDLWHHQPHAPGYPLYIFLGWLGLKLFGASPNASLHFVSAIGGGFFVAAWFLIVRLQFHERLAWWVTGCLTITPVIWMTATKVLTDSLAAGLISAEILAAVYFVRNRRFAALASVVVFGAAAAGVRPQLILAVLAILVTALWQSRAGMKTSILAFSLLIAGCLLWLLPMSYLQWQLRPELSFWSVYPSQAYERWHWRLDKPAAYIGAGDWSLTYLATRFAFHILGWFGLGFGFLQSWLGLVAGMVIVIIGLAAYLFWAKEIADSQFWKFHLPWAAVHVSVIFISLPANQRYYLVIFPLLLVVLLRGFLRLISPWRWSVLALPAVLFFNTIPAAIANHRDETPSLKMVRYLERLYPESTRGRVVLLLSTGTKRHAEWYAPDFITINPIPAPEKLREITKDAVAVYTDDPAAPLPAGWYRIPLAAFSRSVVIHWKGHFVELYLIEGRRPSGDKNGRHGS